MLYHVICVYFFRQHIEELYIFIFIYPCVHPLWYPENKSHSDKSVHTPTGPSPNRNEVRLWKARIVPSTCQLLPTFFCTKKHENPHQCTVRKCRTVPCHSWQFPPSGGMPPGATVPHSPEATMILLVGGMLPVQQTQVGQDIIKNSTT